MAISHAEVASGVSMKCTECNGSGKYEGFYPWNVHDCSVCFGKGGIEAKLSIPSSNNIVMTTYLLDENLNRLEKYKREVVLHEDIKSINFGRLQAPIIISGFEFVNSKGISFFKKYFDIIHCSGGDVNVNINHYAYLILSYKDSMK